MCLITVDALKLIFGLSIYVSNERLTPLMVLICDHITSLSLSLLMHVKPESEPTLWAKQTEIGKDMEPAR